VSDVTITDHESEQVERANATGLTQIIAGRGHALTIDSGWREVAGKALELVKRFT